MAAQTGVAKSGREKDTSKSATPGFGKMMITASSPDERSDIRG
jgi:hypothetical protein